MWNKTDNWKRNFSRFKRTCVLISRRTANIFMHIKRKKHKISYETRVELHKTRQGCAQELEPGNKAPWENKSRKTAHFTWRKVFYLRSALLFRQFPRRRAKKLSKSHKIFFGWRQSVYVLEYCSNCWLKYCYTWTRT